MDSFLAAKAEDIISCTGFSRRLIRTYMQQFAIPEDHVLHLCAAFVMAHMDVSDIQLPDFTSSTLKRHVVAVCKLTCLEGEELAFFFKEEPMSRRTIHRRR